MSRIGMLTVVSILVLAGCGRGAEAVSSDSKVEAHDSTDPTYEPEEALPHSAQAVGESGAPTDAGRDEGDSDATSLDPEASLDASSQTSQGPCANDRCSSWVDARPRWTYEVLPLRLRLSDGEYREQAAIRESPSPTFSLWYTKVDAPGPETAAIGQLAADGAIRVSMSIVSPEHRAQVELALEASGAPTFGVGGQQAYGLTAQQDEGEEDLVQLIWFEESSGTNAQFEILAGISHFDSQTLADLANDGER